MRLLSNSLVLFVGLLALSAAAQAKNKKVKTAPKEPQDEIEVVGHIPLNNGPVRRFLTTQHYSSYYLYAEHEGGKSVTLIDVTKAAHPAVLADVAYPPSGDPTNLSVVAGTAVLVSSGPRTLAQSAPQTMRLMDFSDPQHPKVTREFTGVTALERDDRRGQCRRNVDSPPKFRRRPGSEKGLRLLRDLWPQHVPAAEVMAYG